MKAPCDGQSWGKRLSQDLKLLFVKEGEGQLLSVFPAGLCH